MPRMHSEPITVAINADADDAVLKLDAVTVCAMSAQAALDDLFDAVERCKDLRIGITVERREQTPPKRRPWWAFWRR